MNFEQLLENKKLKNKNSNLNCEKFKKNPEYEECFSTSQRLFYTSEEQTSS